jgi:cytochrome P450
MSSETDVYWDPYDDEIDVDPYPRWKAMRDRAPVYHNDRYDFWALSRYDDVELAHRRPGQYLSSHGVTLETISPKRMASGMMILNDPPAHTRLRSLVNRAFTPRRVAELEPAIRRYSREMLAAWEPGGDFDLVGQFGSELPSMVISELLGVPEVDRDEVHHVIDTVFHIEPGVGMINDTSITAMARLYEYLNGLIAERAAAPGDDLLSALTTAEIGDDESAGGSRSLTDREMVEFGLLLITAGTETVGKLIGWAGLLLGEHPEQQQYLRDHPGAIPNAIEETLRYEPPSPVQGRFVEEPVELRGVTIPAGSKVLLLTGAAGRDERKYADPDRYEVRRHLDRHVSFGYGVHFCLGAALARLEGRVALEETLAHTGMFESDRSASTQVHTSTVRGWESVVVRATL